MGIATVHVVWTCQGSTIPRNELKPIPRNYTERERWWKTGYARSDSPPKVLKVGLQADKLVLDRSELLLGGSSHCLSSLSTHTGLH